MGRNYAHIYNAQNAWTRRYISYDRFFSLRFANTKQE